MTYLDEKSRKRIDGNLAALSDPNNGWVNIMDVYKTWASKYNDVSYIY